MVSKDKYGSYLEKLVFVTHEEPFNRETYLDVIHAIADDYCLAKGQTEFYRSPTMEQRGKGEMYCDVDNGKPVKPLVHLRIVTLTKAIIKGTLFVDADEADDQRSEEELAQLESFLRVILGFVSRRRLIRMIEEFGFFDMSGYRNFRAYARYLDIINSENKLGGKVAFHFDIHNFTMVNQEIGRQNADVVLMNYYKKIEEAIGDTGIIVRLGGDKFLGIFDRKVKRAVYEIFSGVPVAFDEAGERKITISAAVGIYMIPNPFMMKVYGDVLDKVMMASGIAKYQASESIIVYDDKMKARKEHTKKVQSDFRQALEKEEFVVYYQPKVDIDTRKLTGAEALCRWIKDGTIIPPNDFIPILEMGTDICDLDFYMLDHVCSDIRRWLDEGKDVVRISVNFSRKHMVDVDFLDHIIRIVDKHKVPHEYIEVELTETTTDVMFSDLKRVVCGLQEQGIWTAVDDFGVGFSSLNLIRDIPWNVLKIDKSFVPKDVDDVDSVSNKMFKHVISLALDLGLECVTEGVETLEQLEALRRNNCSIAQGYFFDRPLPLDDFEQRLIQGVYPEV